MIDASTADGREQDRPNDAEPFFPSEGTFNAVVPLSEIGRAPVPAPLVRTDAADVGKPAEAVWAREAHRAGVKEEETTLVPTRAGVRGVRRSWVVPAAVITLSVAAGLASGTYLIWSSQRAPQAQSSAQAATEAPSLPPAPVAEQKEAVAKVEQVKEPVKDEKPREVAKAEKSDEAAPAPKHEPPLRTTNEPRAERATRNATEAREVTPAPKPARSQSAAAPRPRVVIAAKQPPAPATSERNLPISSPPSNAKSRKVIQWP
jgi:hypothetical protein